MGRLQLLLVRGRPLYERRTLEAILDGLDSRPRFGPETMRLDEGRRRPFDREHVLSLATEQARAHEVELTREHPIRHRTVLLLGEPPGLEMEVRDPSVAERKEVFDLADELVAIDPPEIAWVHVFEDRQPPHATRDDEHSHRMDAGIVGIGPTYDTLGPGGLGLRTYLGPRLVELIGRERVESLPVPTTQLPTGTIRVDLSDEPWSARPSDIWTSWREAMDHLRPAKVFGMPRLDASGWAFTRRGERFVRP